ncbi:protease [Bdellovibrio sp.]|uniref:protease n=1 Tax=Bdellovibrio sp. TaxID=28201 RepID=UPI0039E23498
MKIKMLLTGLLLMTGIQAAATEFDNGSDEFEPRPLPHYSEAELQKQIENEMAVACSGNLCKIVGQDSHGSGWTVQFQVGYGRANGGNGDTIYIGDYRDNNDNKGFASITVSYKNYKCHSSMLVTPAVYRFVNTYLYNMVNSDGSVKRNFSPADQTVILFYTTMLNKVNSCGTGLN